MVFSYPTGKGMRTYPLGSPSLFHIAFPPLRDDRRKANTIGSAPVLFLGIIEFLHLYPQLRHSTMGRYGNFMVQIRNHISIPYLAQIQIRRIKSTLLDSGTPIAFIRAIASAIS